jgi:hypothetical protein
MEDRQAPDGTSESVGGEHTVASTDPPRIHTERSRREDSLLRVWQSDVCGLEIDPVFLGLLRGPSQFVTNWDRIHEDL